MKILKFFTTSVIATGVDFSIYSGLIFLLSPVQAHFISASVGMITNFILQKKFVFTMTRSMKLSLMLSVMFSLGGILLGAGIISFVMSINFFTHHPIIVKAFAIVMVFFYNYQTKKIAFGDR